MMWSCKRCTFQNGPESEECEMCQLPRSATGDDTESWQCVYCCQFSPAHSSCCTVCGERKQELHSGSPGRLWPAEGTDTERAGRQRQDRDEVRGAGALSTDESGGQGPHSDSLTGSVVRWICQKPYGGGVCSANNDMDVYHCKQCNAVKPYLPELTKIQVTEGVAEMTLDPVNNTSSRLQPEIPAPWMPAVPPADKPQSSRLSTVHGRGRDPDSTDWFTEYMREDRSAETGRGASSSPRLPTGPAGLQDVQVDEEVLAFPDQECRMVLVGKTGNGKSSTGNTILGLNRFGTSGAFSSTTQRCQRHNNVRFGIRMEVVDTPGLFDTSLDQENITEEIAKCFGAISPGPHAILLVIRIGVKFTEEENKAVDEVRKLFGVHLLRFLVIIFTHGDTLENCGEHEREAILKDLLDKSPDKLKQLVDCANHRYVVFDNNAEKASKDRQVKQLVLTIRRLLEVNGGRPFTNKLLDIVERCMQQRELELQEELQGHEGRGRGGSGDGRDDNFQCRDIAREEVVHGSPLLQIILKEILPSLEPLLTALVDLLVKTLVQQSAKGGVCSLQ